MNSEHNFCHVELAQARQEAKEAKIKLPKRITALRSDSRQFFIEADGVEGEYVKGDCACDAKAHYIYHLIDRAVLRSLQGGSR